MGPSAGTPTASTATSIVSTVNSQHRVVAVPHVSAPTVVTPSRDTNELNVSPSKVEIKEEILLDEVKDEIKMEISDDNVSN